MGFEDGLKDDAAFLSTLGAAAHLREQRRNLNEQRKNTEELIKQGKALEVIAESEKARLSIEEQRLKLEQQRIFNEEYDRKIKNAKELEEKENIKLIRKTLSSIDQFFANIDSNNSNSIDYLKKIEIGLWENILTQLENEDKLSALEDINFLGNLKTRFEKLNNSLILSGSLNSTARMFTETEYDKFDKDAESVELKLNEILQNMLSKSFLNEFFDTNSKEKATEKLHNIEDEIIQLCQEFKKRNDYRIIGNNNVELWTSFGDKFGEEEDLPLINDLIQIGTIERAISREISDFKSPVLIALKISHKEFKNLLQDDGKARTDSYQHLSNLNETLEKCKLLDGLKDSPLVSIFDKKKKYLDDSNSLLDKFKEFNLKEFIYEFEHGHISNFDQIDNNYRETKDKLNEILNVSKKDSVLYALIQENASEFESFHKSISQEIEEAKQKKLNKDRILNEKFRQLANDYSKNLKKDYLIKWLPLSIISVFLIIFGIFLFFTGRGEQGSYFSMTSLIIGAYLGALAYAHRDSGEFKAKRVISMAEKKEHDLMIDTINEDKDLNRMKNKVGSISSFLEDKYNDLGIKF